MPTRLYIPIQSQKKHLMKFSRQTASLNTMLSSVASNNNEGRIPVAKLHSIHSLQQPPIENRKILHFIRHAEGTHNVEKDYKNPANRDAPLTNLGIQQCRQFASQKLGNNGNIDFTKDLQCIITSPMRRAIQTAYYCFEDVLFPPPTNVKESPTIPMVASEEWRETVNYLCDQRQETSSLQGQFPYVDFSNIEHEQDPIWGKYEDIFGSHQEHKSHRESGDDAFLEERARAAWYVLANRPESSIAIVSHSAFFMHMFDPLFPRLEGLVQYCDKDVETLMRPKFENCECRSVVLEIL